MYLVLADGVGGGDGVGLGDVEAVSVLATVVITCNQVIISKVVFSSMDHGQRRGRYPGFHNVPSEPSMVIESIVRSEAPLIDTTW